MKLLSIKPSPKPDKKYVAVFETNSGTTKTTHFGAQGMSDFTKNHDVERKQRYLARHKKNERWSDPTSAGSLSKWILWSEPTVKSAVTKFKKHFNL